MVTSLGDVLAWSLSPLGALWRAWALQGPAQIFWSHSAATGLVAVLVALLVDRLWGEPPTWLHPVVYMGKALGTLGQRMAPQTEVESDYKRLVLAALAWCLLASVVGLLYFGLQLILLTQAWWVSGLLAGVLLKPLLSWRMLKDEVLAVEAALQKSLNAGRQRLSWLVSRDTRQLDEATVRESAIETLAENLGDSVIAPLFWFAVAGLPGAAVYRFANTADAMWGYPGWRGEGDKRRHWQWTGKWAARMDDLLNWIPARLAALGLALAAGGVNWAGLRRDAGVTPSPNGGWPMGAMARVLDVHLTKPGVYQLNPEGQAPQADDVHKAVSLAAKVVWGQAVIAVLMGGGLLALVWRGIDG